MIGYQLAAIVLLLQAVFVLRASFDRDDVVRSWSGVAWALALVVSSVLGAFALFVVALG